MSEKRILITGNTLNFSLKFINEQFGILGKNESSYEF